MKVNKHVYHVQKVLNAQAIKCVMLHIALQVNIKMKKVKLIVKIATPAHIQQEAKMEPRLVHVAVPANGVLKLPNLQQVARTVMQVNIAPEVIIA